MPVLPDIILNLSQDSAIQLMLFPAITGMDEAFIPMGGHIKPKIMPLAATALKPLVRQFDSSRRFHQKPPYFFI